jgi:hypothetical protein
MAIPPVIKVPQFPNVPALAGVPQLARLPNVPLSSIIASIGNAAIQGRLWHAVKQAPKWGVFDASNNPVVIPDNIVDFHNSDDSRVSNFPVQDGQFAAYNKVALPSETVVRMTKAGTQSDRKAFLDALKAAKDSLNLYTILTPERSYLKCNLQRFEVIRSGPIGAYFLAEVDLFFIEIKQVSSTYSNAVANTQNAQNPEAQPFGNLGNVAPQATSTSDQAAVTASGVTGQH